VGEGGAGLEGRLAVVTGGGSGIGLATVRRLLAADAEVHAVARSRELIEERLASEPRLEALTAHGLDVTDRAAVDALLGRIGAERPIDVLVCAAGTNVPDRSLAGLTAQNWRRVLDSNLDGAFHFLHEALPQLRESRGHAVVVASVSSLWPDESGAAYQASKAGVLALVRAAAVEEHARGIRFTAILPGMADTPLVDKRPAPPPRDVRDLMLDPDDVAATILFALSLPPRACVAEVTILPTVLQALGRT
jgi:NAD(P)-dependent dehydrogenase (short-subunit alcohol dehydrogenase family)